MKRRKRKFELAVLYTDHTWEDDHWVIATSRETAEGKLMQRLSGDANISHVTVICEQELEEGDEDMYGD